MSQSRIQYAKAIYYEGVCYIPLSSNGDDEDYTCIAESYMDSNKYGIYVGPGYIYNYKLDKWAQVISKELQEALEIIYKD